MAVSPELLFHGPVVSIVTAVLFIRGLFLTDAFTTSFVRNLVRGLDSEGHPQPKRYNKKPFFIQDECELRTGLKIVKREGGEGKGRGGGGGGAVLSRHSCRRLACDGECLLTYG